MPRSSCGTTLIEIIVAVVIFGVLMLSGLSFFSLANQSQANANKLTKAIELCNSAIEKRKSWPNCELVTGTFNETYNGQEGVFYVTIENTSLPTPPNPYPVNLNNNAYENAVHVTVTWPDQGASVVEMSTIFTSTYEGW